MNPVKLDGVPVGPWCPAYHKTKDRTLCAEKQCRYYQNHRVTPYSHQNAGDPDINENLDALSIRRPVVYTGREYFEIHEVCEWHCVRYDEPSKYMALPWEELMGESKS